MRIEQKIVFVYMILGIFLGLVTNYLLKTGIDLIIAMSLPFLVYLSSLFPLISLVKQKKSLLLLNSFITFILVWPTVWILLYSL